MPKLNIYVDEDLLKHVRKYNLPLSQICQEALWAAVDQTETAVCECGQPATFFVQNEEGSVYVCRKHLMPSLYGIVTVRSL